DLVHPAVAPGHCLGGNGAAGDDEGELGHGRHSPGRATSPRSWASATKRAMLSAMAWNAPKSATTTLADLRRCTPWLWVYCERCQHRSPAAIVPLMIRWGAEASSDMLRRSARCTRCGRKGATIQLPGWGGLQTPVPEWPGSV